MPTLAKLKTETDTLCQNLNYLQAGLRFLLLQYLQLQHKSKRKLLMAKLFVLSYLLALAVPAISRHGSWRKRCRNLWGNLSLLITSRGLVESSQRIL